MKKVLITGGLGHIGSHLIRKLPLEYDITVVDNLLTQRYCSLFDLDRNIKFIEKDIDELIEKDVVGIDVVIHLAAITNAERSFKNKEEVENVNLVKTEKFIGLCKRARIPYFIFPSSTSVYGVSADVVYEDDDSVVNPQSPYAETKIGIENLLKNQSDISYLILRFGTIFGESIGMRFHTAINKFCYEVSLGKPLTIWKQNYEQVRPYLGLDDAVNSIIHFLNHTEYFNQTYNVITDNYKLSDVVKSIEKVTDKVELNMVDTPLLNQFSYDVSDDKVKKIGFESKDELEVFVKNTLNKLRNLK
jgi:nucleoside-diphosphate-sugar epimerase